MKKVGYTESILIDSSGMDEFVKAISESPNNEGILIKFTILQYPWEKLSFRNETKRNSCLWSHYRPFITEDKTVANTGSWIDELEDKEKQNSYVEIVDGEMELNSLNEGGGLFPYTLNFGGGI